MPATAAPSLGEPCAVIAAFVVYHWLPISGELSFWKFPQRTESRNVTSE
jgi:hypothetical protein